MFHYMHLVLFLVLLHIKQLPKLFELMEFTESLKNDQHCDKAHQQITCNSNFIQLSEFLIVAFSWHIVSKANGAQGNETKIKRLQKIPVIFQDRKYCCWD